MALRIEELAKTIDHTLLKPDVTRADIEQLCEEARHHHFASVSVFPYYVPLAATLLKSHDVKVCTVISFPFGGDTTRTKVQGGRERRRHRRRRGRVRDEHRRHALREFPAGP